LRFIAFSDLHLHPFRAFASYGERGNSRRLEIAERLRNIVDIANMDKYDAVVFAGDFFHERGKVNVTSMTMAKDILGKLKKPFIACSGTHDLTPGGHSSMTAFKELAATLKTMQGRNRVATFHLDETVTLFDSAMTQWTFVCVPDPLDYSEHYRRIVGAHLLATSNHRTNLILVTHGFVSGEPWGGASWMPTALDPTELNRLFAFSVVGHYHKPAYENRILVPGAAIPHHFGDEEAGGGAVWDVSIEHDSKEDIYRASCTPISFTHPQFRTVRLASGEEFDGTSSDYYRIFTNDPDFVLPEGIKGIVIYEPPAERVATSDRSEIRPADSRRDLVSKWVDRKLGDTRAAEDGEKVSRARELVDRLKEKYKRVGEILASDSPTLTPEEMEEIERVMEER